MPAKVSDETQQEIRSEKSPKKLRERTETLNKEIQKHRDHINRDDYEWRQEDEDKMHRLFDERQACIQRAEFLEQVDDVMGDIDRQDRSDPGDRGRDRGRELRDDDPGDRRQRRNNPAGPLSNEQRSNALNWALARHLGVELSRENRDLVKRGHDAGLFRRGRNTIDIRTSNPSADFRQLQRKLRRGYDLDSMQERDLAVGDGTTSAGLFGTEGFIPLLERVMLYFGPMLQIATIMNTSDGRDTDMPTVDDTGNEADIVDEAADVSATQDPTIGEQTWKTKKLRSKKVKYSPESSEDSVFDLFALLIDLLGERIGRGANRYWTLGNAGGEIQGAVPGAVAGVTTTAAGLADDDVLAQKIVDMYFSVDIAYRNSSGCFMCNDIHLARFSKLKHADGTWMYRFKDGMSDSLWGKPVKPNNHMVATLNAGDEPLLWGDFSKYWIRLVRSVRVRRYFELHGDNDQDAVQLFRRIGGRYVTTGAVRKMVLT